MSEHIVHTAVLEDAFALGVRWPLLSEEFRRILAEQLSFARLGCVTVSGDRFSFYLLDRLKKIWPTHSYEDEIKLGFVLGWINHRACDRQMKPIWNEPAFRGRGTDVDPTLSPTECSVYHEGHMWREYFKDCPVFLYALFPEEAEGLSVYPLLNHKAAYSFLRTAYAMNMMDIQTLPDTLAEDDYFCELCMRAQKFYVDLNRYRKSANDPDPDLIWDFITRINWYDEKDEIVAAARKIRFEGDATFPKNLASAKSHYGMALEKSLSYFSAADLYLHNPDMTVEELRNMLDIGKLGPNGLPV